jgi:nucleotide-binding universal stress UspA family protein
MIFRRDHDHEHEHDEHDAEMEKLREWRKNRFRVLVCIDGSDESYVGVRYAAEIAKDDECDVILLYVRPIDQGLRSGGLQVRVVRQNMMEWGLELPGIQYLKNGLEMLVDEDTLEQEWELHSDHADVWGDPLGDNKIEYRHTSGKSIVLKLKTAPEPASGILDQYELGPYNLIILGAPSHWRAEWNSFWGAGVVQKVATMSPCSVLIAREPKDEETSRHGHLICTDGSAHALDSVLRDAVLAHQCGHPITLFAAARTEALREDANHILQEAKEMLAERGLKVQKTVVGIGDPVETIVDAGRDFDVISVSDSGKSRFKRFLMGSVSFSVMGKAKSSVLNVH